MGQHDGPKWWADDFGSRSLRDVKSAIKNNSQCDSTSSTVDYIACMTWMRPIDTNAARSVVPVCAFDIPVPLSSTKTDEPIDMPFNDRLVWSNKPRIRWRLHWRYLVNTNEWLVCSGCAALCQISSTTCLRLFYILYVDCVNVHELAKDALNKFSLLRQL